MHNLGQLCSSRDSRARIIDSCHCFLPTPTSVAVKRRALSIQSHACPFESRLVYRISSTNKISARFTVAPLIRSEKICTVLYRTARP
jgi:hypothetical protein